MHVVAKSGLNWIYSTVQRKLYIFFERVSSAFRECSSEERDSQRCETQYRELSLDKHKLSLEKPSRNRASRISINSRSNTIDLCTLTTNVAVHLKYSLGQIH